MRFKLQKSELKHNHWVSSDTENGIVCIFENGDFNESQEVTFLKDVKKPNPLKIAEYMREMSDWLVENHKEKLF